MICVFFTKECAGNGRSEERIAYSLTENNEHIQEKRARQYVWTDTSNRIHSPLLPYAPFDSDNKPITGIGAISRPRVSSMKDCFLH